MLDGLDGSGKTTQFGLLLERLSVKKHAVKGISFPDYSNPSSGLVKMYLSGELSREASGVNAYAASSFYAVDRYASYKRYWEEDYNSGKLILASRYTTSNAIHQMGKLPRDEWDNFLGWLHDYEYVKLGLPKPDGVILLDMPVECAVDMIAKRNGNVESESNIDIHETDTIYLRSCRESAHYAASRLGWQIVPCLEGRDILSREQLSLKIDAIWERFM